MKKIIIGTVAIIAVAILTITLFGDKSMAKTKQIYLSKEKHR